MFLTQQTGFLGPFAYVLGKLFEIIYNLLADGNGIANLGICIIIFTVVVKIIMFPFTFKQQKSSKINMMIQPELEKVQKKYKDKKDQESVMKQQQEMQEIYDKYGTSMTSGCLGSLIQLPIIYALYRVIQKIPAYVPHVYDLYRPIADKVVEGQGLDKAFTYLQEFVKSNSVSGATYSVSQVEKLLEKGAELNINHIVDTISNFGVTSLKQLADSLNFGPAVANSIDSIENIYTFLGINISDAPGFHLGLPLLIPILSALFQYLSMKVSMSRSSDTGNNSSQTMMKSMSVTMPVMSFVMCITLPSFIGIYWATSAAVTMLTQIFVNAYYDHIDMDELLQKQMEKAAKKKKKGKKSLMQRMLENSEEMQAEMEKMQAMRDNSSRSLKNYTPSEEKKNTSVNKTYKKGSIGSKANIMLNYNDTNKEK